jgi:integrase
VWYAVVSVGQGNKRKTIWRSLPQCKGKKEAEIECAKIVLEIASGGFTLPDNATLAQWAEHWVSIGCPGRRRKAVGAHTNERYANYLRLYVLPTLGQRPLQKLQSTEIDALYKSLEDKPLEDRLATTTRFNVHITLSSCLSAAVRAHKIPKSPIADLNALPARGESDHGVCLDEAQLRKLIQGFRDHPLHTVVNVAAFTGARRAEILALRWEDFDPIARTLRIERSIEHTRRHGLRVKGPKSERGNRTIEIDASLVTLLLAERERHLRIVAGVPDGVDVNLSLVKLPTDALMFPALPGPGEQVSLTKLRLPQSVTESFTKRAARIGFPDLRFHDLRGTHETMLLDMGIPVHVVAARGGHDPAVLLHSYAKRTKKGDAAAVSAIAAIARNITGK